MTQEVAGLAPELKGAKKGQGQAPILSASERFTAYAVEAFEVPGGREENWRFTPLRRLRGLHTDTVAFDGHATVEVEGVEAETVGRDDPRLGEGGVPADRVAAAAWSAFREATVVTLDGTPAPVTVTVTGPGEGAAAASHLQLRTTPFAEATVVLEQRGSGTLADNLEVVLAEGSRLTLFVTEEWADDAVHVGAHHFALGRDATLRTTTIALGGDLVRVDFPDPTVVAYGIIARDRSEAIYTVASIGTSDVTLPGRVRFPGLDPERRYRARPVLVGRPPSGLDPPPWWGAITTEFEPSGERRALGWGLPEDGGPGLVLSGAALASAGLMAAGMHPEHAILYRVEALD